VQGAFIPISMYIKIIKIHQDFSELWSQMYCHVFLWITVYISQFWYRQNSRLPYAQWTFSIFSPRDATLARYMPSSCVCLSVTSRCFTETAKCRIKQTTLHTIPMDLVSEDLGKTQTRSPPTEAPNACGVGSNWRLSTKNSLSKTSTVSSVVNLVRSQERPPLFAACMPWCST